MTIKFGRKFEVQGNSRNYTTIFIKTDWNDADYIATSTDVSHITPEMDAMLWCLRNVVDLQDPGESFYRFLDKYVPNFEDSFNSFSWNGMPIKSTYQGILSEWLFEELDFPFADNANDPHGHTLVQLKVTQFEDGSVYDIDYRDHNKVQGEAVAKFLIKMVDDWNKRKIAQLG